MNDKIVFFDIDGTLLDENKDIPISTKRGIEQLKNKGIHVVIATGRAPFMFKNLREELDIQSYISFNGSFVVLEGDVVYKKPLDRAQLHVLEQQANDGQHPLVFLDDEQARSNVENHPHIRACMEGLKMSHPPFDAAFFHDRDIYQALLFCQSEQEESYMKKHHSFDFIRWHDYSLDILPAGGSKAKGVEVVANELSIPVQHTYAFGDALNDIEMLKYVGTGVAMGNGLDEVKRAANFVTATVSEEGILIGLKKVGLL